MWRWSCREIKRYTQDHTVHVLWSHILNPMRDFSADDQMTGPSNHAGGDFLIIILPLSHFVQYFREKKIQRWLSPSEPI